MVEAQAIHTDTAGLDAGEVQIPVKDGNLPAYYARPAKGTSFPVVLVNEEMFGVHEYIKDVCRRFAKLGYMAVAPEIYARIADLSKVTDSASRSAARSSAKKPDAELYERPRCDARLGGDRTRAAPPDRRDRLLPRRPHVWLYAAHNPKLKAAVAWYGVLERQPPAISSRMTALDIADQLKCPLLGLYGGKDSAIPVARRRGGGGQGQGCRTRPWTL